MLGKRGHLQRQPLHLLGGRPAYRFGVIGPLSLLLQVGRWIVRRRAGGLVVSTLRSDVGQALRLGKRESQFPNLGGAFPQPSTLIGQFPNRPPTFLKQRLVGRRQLRRAGHGVGQPTFHITQAFQLGFAGRASGLRHLRPCPQLGRQLHRRTLGIPFPIVGSGILEDSCSLCHHVAPTFVTSQNASAAELSAVVSVRSATSSRNSSSRSKTRFTAVRAVLGRL